MHARARVVGDIDEVSHNKRAGKNETIMIMRRAVCAATEGGPGKKTLSVSWHEILLGS